MANSTIESTDLSAGEVIIANVKAHGIDTIFAIPGAQTYPLFDGMHRFGLKTIVPRHEQAAAYMAMGYAKSTGNPAVFSVVPGPGVLNTAAALCTAMGNGAPIICLTADIPSAYRGRGRGHLHELRDQQRTLRSIIKNTYEVTDIYSIPSMVQQAFQDARSGRPGPVAIQMSWDDLARSGPDPGVLKPLPILKPEIDPQEIAAAAELIRTSRTPMIMCGGGAQNASTEVLELAQKLKCPVSAFRGGRGVVPDDHPLAAPAVTARQLWEDVDLLIGIGSRLEMPYMRWQSAMEYSPHPPGPKLLRMDIDAAEMHRLVPDIGVIGDAADVCRAVVTELGKAPLNMIDQRNQVACCRARARRLLDRIQPQVSYLDVIRTVLPADAFIVPELSQVGFTTYTDALPIYMPRTYVSEGHQGTLGFGFPTALGVKVANPSRAVVSITGDGGFMFGVQELATAAQYQIGVVIVLFNNNSFGNVLRDQQRGSGRVIASRLSNPDFIALAHSFGVAANRVKSPAGLESALEHALATNEPHLIEVTIAAGSEASPWPFIHMHEPPVI